MPLVCSINGFSCLDARGNRIPYAPKVLDLTLATMIDFSVAGATPDFTGCPFCELTVSNFQITSTASAVPEPATFLLTAGGLALLRRRRSAKRAPLDVNGEPADAGVQRHASPA
jgi:hypothetical protein